ncbi:MAG: SMC family ATPase, partial [Clostridia bacterium]|nr:SMC family ATPase [Clostridia bacterium]
MKPIKLEIEGLNSFETKQVLDFESLGNGVFGIFGKTGSGKSTILDAITLALYGKVERTKQNVDFVNTKSSKATVSLEFEIFSAGKTRRLLVTRVFSRKKSGTEVDSSASLYEIDGDDKNLIEEGSSKVGDKIFGILGLGVNEFAKCIALPQGEFSAFLQAKPAERTEIMSNIFDLSKYGEKLAFAVKEKISMWDKEVSVLSASRDMVAYATDDVLSATKSGLEETRKQYEETSNLLGEKSRKLAKIKTDASKKEELEKVVQNLKKLEEQEDEISKLSVQIEKGQSANEVRADYEKLNKATADEKELSEKIAELNEVKLKKQSEVQSAEIEFVDFKNVYDEKIVELNAKIARLLELENDEAEVKKAEVEKQETVEKIKEKQTELSAEQENNAYFVSVLTDIQGKITAIDEFIEKNKPDVDLSYALEQTKGVESELILIEDYYKRLENLIDQTEIELKRNQEDYADCIKREKDLQAKREKIVNSIEVAFEDVDNTDFKKIRSLDNELDGMREVKALNQKIDEQILKLVENNDAKRAIIVSIENEIYVEEKKLNDFETSILAKEKDLEAFREERDGLFGENVISMISNHLKIGDNCPVCDNRVVQNLSCEANDMSGIEGQIAHANAELSNLRYERDKMFA